MAHDLSLVYILFSPLKSFSGNLFLLHPVYFPPKLFSVLFSPCCLSEVTSPGFLSAWFLHALFPQSFSHSVKSNSLQPYGLTAARQGPRPWNSPGKNTGVGCHSLLQGIFLTQWLNLCLLHCRQILYYLSHLGSPHFLNQAPAAMVNIWLSQGPCCVFKMTFPLIILRGFLTGAVWVWESFLPVVIVRCSHRDPQLLWL